MIQQRQEENVYMRRLLYSPVECANAAGKCFCSFNIVEKRALHKLKKGRKKGSTRFLFFLPDANASVHKHTYILCGDGQWMEEK